jgi:hypothetical protein
VGIVKNHNIDLLSSRRHSGYAGNAMRVALAMQFVSWRPQVFKTLQQATDGLSDDAFNQAFDNALQKLRTETATPGTTLNKLATGG